MEQTDIKTRPDGSIDTAFYMDRGRHARSEMAWSLGGGGLRSLTSFLAGLLTFGVARSEKTALHPAE